MNLAKPFTHFSWDSFLFSFCMTCGVKFTNEQRIDTSVNVITMVTDQVHTVMCVGPDNIFVFFPPAPGSTVSEAELSVRE